jgi:hypothetical protein
MSLPCILVIIFKYLNFVTFSKDTISTFTYPLCGEVWRLAYLFFSNTEVIPQGLIGAHKVGVIFSYHTVVEIVS